MTLDNLVLNKLLFQIYFHEEQSFNLTYWKRLFFMFNVVTDFQWKAVHQYMQ